MRNTTLENVQEHSHMVAILAHALAVLEQTQFGGQVDPSYVAVVALYHDAGEILTGDLPTPIKYDNPEICAAYRSVEETATQTLLSMLPANLRPVYQPILSETDPHVHRLVKAADKLAAYLKCVEELKTGNREFYKAKDQTFQALRQHSFPALDYFIQQFLPSFELTLDELQQEQRKDEEE